MVQIIKRAVLTTPATEPPEDAGDPAQAASAPVTADDELRSIKANLAALREDAKKEGFQQGFATGQSQARAQQHVMQTRWDQLTASVAKARDSAILQDEGAVVALTLEACARILGDRIDVREVAVEVVRAAVSQYQADSVIRVLLSQEDFQFLRDQGLSLSGITSTQVEASPKVQNGGCIIETRSGFVDARVETQLERLMEVFFAARSSAKSHV